MYERVPTRDEINIFNTLDELSAVEHFLGKDLGEAESLFRENFLYYQEALMWMGTRAFCYYVNAAIAYLLDSHAAASVADLSSFCKDVEFRLDWDEETSILDAIPAIISGLEKMHANYSRYDDDPQLNAEIYGDVRAHLAAILVRLRTIITKAS